MDNDIILKTGDKSFLSETKELWEELNQLHIEKSLYFQQHYNTFTFQARKQALLANAEKGKLLVVIAYYKDVKIGYCVASIVDDSGEIDSLYNKPEYRNRGIGNMLMEASLNWIKANSAKTISIAVSVGNEEVFGFYEKYGFKPRLTVLQLSSV